MPAHVVGTAGVRPLRRAGGMFKLPAVGSPERCALAEADSQLTPDGTQMWAELKAEATALLRRPQPRLAAAKYAEAYTVASSMMGPVQPRATLTLSTLSSAAALHVFIPLIYSACRYASADDATDLVPAVWCRWC